MNEILPINLYKMDNESHFSYHVGVMARILSNHRVKALTSAFVPVYREAMLLESEFLLILRNRLAGDGLIPAYMRRDTCYLEFVNTIEAFPEPSDIGVRRACMTLRRFIMDNRMPPSMRPDQETELMTGLVSDLEMTYGAEVKRLSLGDTVSRLKSANEEVRMLMGDCHWEKTVRRIDQLKDTRLQVDDIYLRIVERINTCARLENDAECAAFICQVNARMVRYE